MKYYTYNEATHSLEPADEVLHIVRGGEVYTIVNGTAEDYASLTPPAYPIGEYEVPTPGENQIVVKDGYELNANHEWVGVFHLELASLPSLSEYDAAMEAHLLQERVARGYTSREPDSYLTSSVPRWKQDAEDWVTYRDAVMEYALSLINGVQAGQIPQPTIKEFVQGLPKIKWTFEGNAVDAGDFGIPEDDDGADPGLADDLSELPPEPDPETEASPEA